MATHTQSPETNDRTVEDEHANRERLIERRVLACLAETDATLETIHARLKRPFGRHHGVSDGACDQSVARLVEAGLVTVTGESDRSFGPASTTAGHPREKYAITDTGKEDLRSLAREPLRPAADVFSI